MCVVAVAVRPLPVARSGNFAARRAAHPEVAEVSVRRRCRSAPGRRGGRYDGVGGGGMKAFKVSSMRATFGFRSVSLHMLGGARRVVQ